MLTSGRVLSVSMGKLCSCSALLSLVPAGAAWGGGVARPGPLTCLCMQSNLLMFSYRREMAAVDAPLCHLQAAAVSLVPTAVDQALTGL